MRPNYPLYDGRPPPASRALRVTLAVGRTALAVSIALIFNDFAHEVNPVGYDTVSRHVQGLGGPVGDLAARLHARRSYSYTDPRDPFGSLIRR